MMEWKGKEGNGENGLVKKVQLCLQPNLAEIEQNETGCKGPSNTNQIALILRCL